ncbi:hypothetical protein GOBAR_DD36167 [Gossypium barbadense]|nr:hypothetical protein GOBAR_DD36167 [Gossypium barbadense]
MAEHSSSVNSCFPSRRGPPLVSLVVPMTERLNFGICTKEVLSKHFLINLMHQIRSLQAGSIVKILEGHQHNFEKNLLKCGCSPDGSKVTAGSSDRMVYIWDTTSRRILFKLPGHTGSVNETIFHPNEPIVGSCSSDKQI